MKIWKKKLKQIEGEQYKKISKQIEGDKLKKNQGEPKKKLEHCVIRKLKKKIKNVRKQN